MFGNYMTLAFRSILKNRLVSLINLGGLSVALAFGTLAVVFAYNELTYDRFHINAERIYRINQRMGDRSMSRTPWRLGPAIANEFPNATVVRVFKSSGSVSNGEKSLRFWVSYVDPSFLDVFSFPMAIGDASTALRDVRSIVIRKVFGTSVSRLMARLSIDFTKIVILAAIGAGPVVYFALREWLQNFVYRIDLIAPIIAGAVLASAFVMLAVSCKTYMAAMQNPADTLRDE